MKVHAPTQSLHVVTVCTEDGAVTGEIVDTLLTLQELVGGHGEPAEPLKVVLVARQSECDAGAALVEATRGVAQALARELGAGIRINAVVCDAASESHLQPTLDFLAGAGAGYVTGATIDLRRPR